MNIENLSERWNSLWDDAHNALLDVIKANDGVCNFINDDMGELCLVPIDATYDDQYGSFYVTSIMLEDNGIKFYGIEEQACLDSIDAVQLSHVTLSGILDILEYLSELNKL